MSGCKPKRQREEEPSAQTPARKLVGFFTMPENLAEMTDEEIDKLAGEIVAEFRTKMGRPDRR